MLRRPLMRPDNTAYRIVNSEGDFLPGLIVDRYGTGLCIQVLTAGMERFREQVLGHLKTVFAPGFIFERSDTEARKREGLDEKSGLICGTVPDQNVFEENGLRFSIDIADGQKTGFFLDQRCNRLLCSEYAANASVCDCFAYSGGFSVYALSHGARHVHTVDISSSALSAARNNIAINDLPPEKVEFIEADVFTFLRHTAAFYNMIILDPPKFARHRGEVERAARGYKDINLMAFRKISRDGIVFTFSCSNAIEPRLFRQIVFAAAADSGRRIQVLHLLSAGYDHPVNISHPEGDYLKGLVLRVE
jgi:23S rRNA (cytosine1962-C5)-methyltransferase